MTRRPDITGKQFGKWTVLKRVERKYYWLCRCDCGFEKPVYEFDLCDGKSTQCANCNRIKHLHTFGGRQSPTYSTWMCMRRRCYEPSMNDYMRYGGRGISVCERWENFENFLADMGERPSGHVIDRIDPKGNYEPKNCRWITYKESAIHRSSTKWVMKFGNRVLLSEAAAQFGVCYITLKRFLAQHNLGNDVSKIERVYGKHPALRLQ